MLWDPVSVLWTELNDIIPKIAKPGLSKIATLRELTNMFWENIKNSTVSFDKFNEPFQCQNIFKFNSINSDGN